MKQKVRIKIARGKQYCIHMYFAENLFFIKIFSGKNRYAALIWVI